MIRDRNRAIKQQMVRWHWTLSLYRDFRNRALLHTKKRTYHIRGLEANPCKWPNNLSLLITSLAKRNFEPRTRIYSCDLERKVSSNFLGSRSSWTASKWVMEIKGNEDANISLVKLCEHRGRRGCGNFGRAEATGSRLRQQPSLRRAATSWKSRNFSYCQSRPANEETGCTFVGTPADH